MVGIDIRGSTAALVALAVVLGCSGARVEVRDDYDPDTDWSGIRRFVWFGIQARGGISEFDVKRIANAIRGDLRRKGLREVGDRAAAAIGVAAYLGVLPKAVDVWKHEGGILWTKGKDLVPAGALVVEVIDLRHGALVWRGAAERRLRENPSRRDADRAIEETVKKLLASFPPPPG